MFVYASNTSEALHQGEVDDEAQNARLDALEAAMLLRTRWVGTWVPDTTYELCDQVVDDGWLMIANKQTIDRPAPQPVGDPVSDLPDTPAFVEQLYTGVVQAGTEYILEQSGWGKAIEVWAPEVGPNITYRVTLINFADPANPIATVINNPILTANDWTTLIVDSVGFSAGTKLQIYLEALNSSAETIVTGDWTRAANNNGQTTNPGLGNWGTRNNSAQLRINKTDLGSVDRTTELGTIDAGSTISIVDTTDPTKYMTWHIDGAPVDNAPGDATGHYYWSDITYDGSGPNGEPDTGQDCTITATVPTPSPTKYEEIANNWPTNQPPWATVRGLLLFDNVAQAADDNAYGVRFTFQPAYISPDWDIQADKLN